MSAANRRRGHDCERTVARYLREHGFPEAATTRSLLGSDGRRTPGDVVIPGAPVVIEVKDRKASSWPSWQRQVMAECGPDQAPLVVRRTRGLTDPGRWTCRVHARTWLSIVRSEEFDDDDLAEDEWWSYSFAMAVADVRNMDRSAA